MKTGKLGTFNAANLLALSLLLSAAAFSCKPPTAVTAQVVGPIPSYNPFFVRNYGGKCLDFGPPPYVSGALVFIYDCNGSAAQRVVTVEVDPRLTSRHSVWLFAGDNKVIGVKGNALIQQAPLELQDYNGSAGQIFELDGDSIILAADRNLVVEVQHARGANRTPLMLGNRDLADAEFWTFTSSDGSNRRPTRGFVRISQIGGERVTRLAFLQAVRNAAWGSVIELDQNVSINLTNVALEIPAGVTVRGDRRGGRAGPLLTANEQKVGENPHFPESDSGMLMINGDEVRVTGLRMRGPGGDDVYANGISTQDQFNAIIDHNEIFNWAFGAAVYVTSEGVTDHRNPHSRRQNLRVVRNFIHHNNRNGYGVVTYGGYPSIEGNTFIFNRHSIAATNEVDTAYSAWFNLALSASPPGQNHDFDAHGTGENDFGGNAGLYFEIAGNTFLGGNRRNFILRGTPSYRSVFHHNVSLLSRKAALENWGEAAKLDEGEDSQFHADNPSNRLGVGDFDGDGAQDLFLATGAAWYYSPSGKAEWRYLNAQTDKLGTLLFGDFDGDGRTDVFTQHAYNWDVSWGGAGPWESLNVSWAILGNAAVGDFIGDERDDIFYADGHTWYVSDGAVSQFTPLDTSSYRLANLRFGDFNGDGKTDVFSVEGGFWKVAYSGTAGWTPLRAKLTDSVAHLTVADFNGDGRADVATSRLVFPPGGLIWAVSYSGTGEWTTFRTNSPSLDSAAAIGRFDGNAGADVLLWHANYLDVARAAGTAVRHSREDMR